MIKALVFSICEPKHKSLSLDPRLSLAGSSCRGMGQGEAVPLGVCRFRVLGSAASAGPLADGGCGGLSLAAGTLPSALEVSWGILREVEVVAGP